MFTNYALDTFVAPKFSQLTACNAPALREREQKWLNVFVLNSIFRLSLNQPTKQQMFNFLRKVEAAFDQYCTARALMPACGDEGHISKYFSALRHFEHCIGVTYQACMAYRRLIGGRKLFQRGDGSALDRLLKLYNLSKHTEEKIDEVGYLPNAQATVTIWLTNDGLESTVASLAFAELAVLLEELGDAAETVANPPLPVPETEAAAPEPTPEARTGEAQ